MISSGTEGWFSIDTGEHATIFSDHYFNMNERHMKQDLFKMLFDEKEVRKVSKDILTLNFGLHEDL